MRLDEYGRWVSDDGAYIWDETAQVWQPATVSVPLPPPPSPLGADSDLPARAGGQTDWLDPAGSGTGGAAAASWPDTSWGSTGEYSLPPTGQASGADPASTWSSSTQSADVSDTGSYQLDTGGLHTGGLYTGGADTGGQGPAGLGTGALGTGGWPVRPADPLDSGAYPLHTGGLDTGGLDSGGYDTGGYDTSGYGTGGWQSQAADPLTDTGASAWGGADSGTGAHALWQPADTGEVEAWAPISPGTEAMSPPTGPTPLWSADPGNPASEFAAAGGTAAYAPTGAYPSGQWPAAVDGDFDDGDFDDADDVDDSRGFQPSGASARSKGRRVPGGRRPLDDDDLDDGPDEPRSGRLAALTRSRPALLGIGLVAVALLGFLTFALLGGGGDEAGDSTQQAAGEAIGRYEEEFRRSYLDTCIQASTNNAADYCSCTLDKFEADYTQDEFVRLSTDPTGAESREAVRLVTESCRAGQ